MPGPRVTIAVAGCLIAFSGCGGHHAKMHSLAAVGAAFAGHGEPLVVVKRSPIATLLVSRAPALSHQTSPPPRSWRFVVIVITERRWMDRLKEHERAAEGALGPSTEFSTFSTRSTTRRDNVILAYPAGRPKRFRQLKAALDGVN